MTVWSLAPTTVTPASWQPGRRLAELVVGVPHLQAEVVEPEATAAGHGGGVRRPTSISSSSWWVRPEVKAAAGIPSVDRERHLPAEHVAVERGRPLEVPHVEHQVPQFLHLHLVLLVLAASARRPPVRARSVPPGGRSPSGQAAVQPLPARGQRLGQHPGVGHRRHEVGVALPAGHGVEVQVPGDPGAGRLARGWPRG